MNKMLLIMAAAMVVAVATSATATARSYHYRDHHHYYGRSLGFHNWTPRFRGSNAELRGNNGNSASGSNSLANPENASGPH
jgi:hypothetical protein